MEYRPVVPGGVPGVVPGLQDYHVSIPDLSPPRSQGSSTGGASSIGDYVPRMYTPPTPPTPHEDDKVALSSPSPAHPRKARAKVVLVGMLLGASFFVASCWGVMGF